MMTKIKTAITGVATAAVLAGSMLVGAPAAEAAPYGMMHNHHNNWQHNDWHNRGRGGSDYLVPGIVGFVAGLALSNAVHHNNGSCAARFNSYNPRTGMYLGYDGVYHRCYN